MGFLYLMLLVMLAATLAWGVLWMAFKYILGPRMKLKRKKQERQRRNQTRQRCRIVCALITEYRAVGDRATDDLMPISIDDAFEKTCAYIKSGGTFNETQAAMFFVNTYNSRAPSVERIFEAVALVEELRDARLASEQRSRILDDLGPVDAPVKKRKM
ncbi:hypothetical protein [Pseudoxanthomonas winnipegensis]|uniref:Uncharacterized protein n=1 Tax=Pseudoxanthomonas winnipegensis TaxID=2480810 RepID=A0A4Q8M2X5_9GAMM|nr:hypothetical protein [Pseudoxanthomonas winnipegensis]TAA41557.1 hypothetical protein EA655_11485 [Pseudoxanthomonas winnipegensis]